MHGRVTVILCTGTKRGQRVTRFLLLVHQMSTALRGPQAGCTDQQEKALRNRGDKQGHLDRGCWEAGEQGAAGIPPTWTPPQGQNLPAGAIMEL